MMVPQLIVVFFLQQLAVTCGARNVFFFFPNTANLMDFQIKLSKYLNSSVLGQYAQFKLECSAFDRGRLGIASGDGHSHNRKTNLRQENEMRCVKKVNEVQLTRNFWSGSK